MKPSITIAFTATLTIGALQAAQPADHLVLEPAGKANGKHVVLLSGDEEYRSEESMPMLAQILSSQGFKCTVLFSVDENGIVNPDNQKSLSNSISLDSADAIVIGLRFRNWDDTSMQRFENALERGTPIVALRTSTHAFKFPKDSKWFKYSFNASKETGWHRGFGRQVLGETWVSHHGKHKVQGTRSVVEAENKNHPVLNGVGEIFGTTDVYGANPLKPSTILLRGQVTKTLDPKSPALEGKKNDPMQPIAWTREFKHEDGTVNRILTTTMGAATDLVDEDLRRLVVNGVYWGLKMDVPAKADVTLPGAWNPSPYSFKAYQKNKKPEDFLIKASTSKLDIVPTAEVTAPEKLNVGKGNNIVIEGAGLASRMAKFGQFETELYVRYPEADLTIRNKADEGNTPGFRPHPGRKDQYAFPGAKDLVRDEFKKGTGATGHFETPDQWTTRLQADTIISFFGFNSSFGGPSDVERFKKELAAYIDHTLSQKYNGKSAPQLAIVSPTAIEDVSDLYDVPSPDERNDNLKLYTEAMKEVCAEHGALFVDVFTPSLEWYKSSKDKLTIDGLQLTDAGYAKLAPYLADKIFGKTGAKADDRRAKVLAAVQEKNWMWHQDYKIPNGVHVYGRRYNPFGPQNYPHELKKTREMTVLRDKAIWSLAKGNDFDLMASLAKLDKETYQLPEVPTNYKPSNKNGTEEYKYGDAALKELNVPEGFKIELFADERMFKELANPVQISFDNKGRLWVACMPSYPHYKVGDPKPTDTLLILEDTDNDGKADKKTVFAGDLHIPIGFEIAPEGVYVSQSDSLVLLKDTDGDDKYDEKEIIASGFDDHDTHHAISAFCVDPSGAIYMGEGVFLHSNIETPYGPVRGTNGGFMRYNPAKRHFERTAQLNIPNPWGIAFDEYGQNFFLHTSGTALNWMMPGTIKPKYGHGFNASRNLVAQHNVRPTSGLEFVSSRHFPEEMQGDILINNNIGFLGIKQHKVEADGTGYKLTYRQDLLKSNDGNFRPVDLEFAPDGSLYLIDWSNTLIGHMQHNARDPYRDHVHGRVYRITYPSRPLVKPANVAGAPIKELLENLKLPEYRTRYRTRRELRGRKAGDVLPALKQWVAGLDKNDPNYDHNRLEALWVTWGLNEVDATLLKELLGSSDYRVRAAAVRTLRYNLDKVDDAEALLLAAAQDEHGQVRLEAVVTASWLSKSEGLPVVDAAMKKPVDNWMKGSFNRAHGDLSGQTTEEVDPEVAKLKKQYKGAKLKTMLLGHEVYHREAHCVTCHQADGKGLPAANFPPITKTKWVNEDPDRLIKLTLKGLMGPITVQGKEYNGSMTPFEGLLNDKEMAAVLTYVRNSFGNNGSDISPDQVKKIRSEIKAQKLLFNAPDLLKQHPHKN
ncbi:putative membrane-bound dehydrogenase domain-containing protein [Rubritalea squalenifaciens DSM 18772]|uniref:Putative membrane-bound dehydrogenase domain-containing protein n=1 Tax=Rubritalea squalenifaciens DSM 18772 TaxID=1123071 RepID=A0A1M6PV78_9BACT|nr:PVC-type heme-binding CxxCH protein [Rubritalea squalenifaciens]SHK11817.1 putative membrane-bound dehydrogenase domain-containing protein [Rubritalea squalenifaciens DSM 18772]